jgi:hypothetical protein
MSRPAGETALDTPGEAGRAEAHRRWLDDAGRFVSTVTAFLNDGP